MGARGAGARGRGGAGAQGVEALPRATNEDGPSSPTCAGARRQDSLAKLAWRVLTMVENQRRQTPTRRAAQHEVPAMPSAHAILLCRAHSYQVLSALGWPIWRRASARSVRVRAEGPAGSAAGRTLCVVQPTVCVAQPFCCALAHAQPDTQGTLHIRGSRRGAGHTSQQRGGAGVRAAARPQRRAPSLHRCPPGHGFGPALYGHSLHPRAAFSSPQV